MHCCIATDGIDKLMLPSPSLQRRDRGGYCVNDASLITPSEGGLPRSFGYSQSTSRAPERHYNINALHRLDNTQR